MTEWLFAIAFTFGGLLSGWIYGHWDGLGQAFIGAMGAFLLGMLVERKSTESDEKRKELDGP